MPSGPRPTDFETMIYQARNERAFPGEGNLDLAGMLSVLPDGVPLSLEAPVKSLAEQIDARRARATRAAGDGGARRRRRRSPRGDGWSRRAP